ncbi:MAG: pyruvate, phosphate dikinase [Methylococcales bacterium]|jgi:pyruvate, orthophosphate dikinase|nr:pyruvate, phosphate dikinase [Methylococcales bacterium]
MSKQYVFAYEDGDGQNKKLLGGKGANLCEMTQIGLNVPPGFVITTESCLDFLKNSKLPENLLEQVKSNIQQMEIKTGKTFGKGDNPLLVSVRSGSAMSMPGMMDTILNLGLNPKTLQGLIKHTQDERFSYDAYRRFIQLFGNIALNISDDIFNEQFNEVKQKAGIKIDVALNTEHLKEICERFLTIVQQQTGKPFPEDVYQQLELAIKAVFKSWSGKRAIDYRKEFNITPAMANGTAVNIVTMVFGNMGQNCATGVGFTRDPGTGENVLFGEYLVNAQGEDVVAGIRTPKPVQEMADEMPEMYHQLIQLRNKLETHYCEIQDFEYTIEKGILYCLQTRHGKMNATAMVRTSVEMTNEKLISQSQALMRINPAQLEQLLHPQLDPKTKAQPIAIGLPASPGAAYGICTFEADKAVQLNTAGHEVMLVREETKPEDIHGFFAAQGILTSRGGKTSHAAVVARGMGKPCVAGAEGIKVDVFKKQAVIGETTIHEGDLITIDGSNGNVYLGKIETIPPAFSDELKTLLEWADQTATLKVLANADTETATRNALKYGAKGIGLCRTERMFNGQDRLPLVIEMILADNKKDRQNALDNLLPIQKQDFKVLFNIMNNKTVTIRLLDPPIHEFLPTEQQLVNDIEELQQLQITIKGVNKLYASRSYLKSTNHFKTMKAPFDEEGESLIEEAIAKKQLILKTVRELFEVNPMLGHRGVRLGITYPEIYKMQIQAIFEVAAECIQQDINIFPEIMIPQVCTAEELITVKQWVDQLQNQVEKQYKVTLNYKFGSMIEAVRACMCAYDLAKTAEFFSFGTNDLTQATFSFSREDAENKFLPLYIDNKILQNNPFEVLDTQGVGKLMEMTLEWGKQTRPDIKVGICGEQGGHPESIHFCHQIGLDYVSCSAPRVPIARLAAAQAVLSTNQ